MAGTKKTIKEITLGRDKDIRVRYAKPATFKELIEVGRVLKLKYIPDIVVKLIHSYREDQKLISSLQGRNTQLHAAISKMNAEREASKKLLSDFIKYTEKFNGMTVERAKAQLKKLGGAVPRRQTR
jgi:hypothetical protein